MAERLGPGVIVLYGRDEYRVAERLRALTSTLDPAVAEFNRSVVAGERLTPGELRAQLEVLPFLSARRLVIVTGLLERFDEVPRSARRQAEVDAFVAALGEAPPTTVAILVGGDLRPARNPLLSALHAAGATVERFSLLREGELVAWIQARARQRQLQLQPEAVTRLAALVGPNLWTLEQEIEKLALWAGQEPVDAATVALLTPAAREESVFRLVDTLLAGQEREAARQLTVLLASGESPFGILALLQQRVRQLWLVRELAAAGLSPAEVKHRAGLGYQPEDLFRDLYTFAGRLSAESVRALHHALLETDEAIKTGRRPPELALLLLTRTLSEGRG
jgi:DNA polymerase-3 subunit delta